jgi:hypothetical protein
MDLSRLGRNDSCPCGSGKKFKRCHLGREDELLALLEKKLNPNSTEVAQRIIDLPSCDHPRAREMADSLELVSAAGKKLEIKFVDLASYLQMERSLRLEEDKPGPDPEAVGGIFLNPARTRALEPTTLFMALSPQADDCTVVHQLAHVVDLVEGSRLHPGVGVEKASEMGMPSEFLEHPQEFGDRLLQLSERFGVELDADDEIVAFLARRQLLMPAKLITEGKREKLVAEAERILSFLRQSQDEINARIKSRKGYVGKKAKAKA